MAIQAPPTGLSQRAFIPPPQMQASQAPSPGSNAINVPFTVAGADAIDRSNHPLARQFESILGNSGTGQTTEAGVFSGIDFGLIPDQNARAQTIDDIIRATQPVAEDILRAGTASAIDFSRASQEGVEGSLSQFLRPQALEEQSALLGAQGADAQAAAIAGIPVSAAQQEADRRQTVGLQRRAAAGGELGAGSTLLASGQLAGQQQANRVAGRVEQLEQLAGIDRQLLGDISRNREAELSRQAALQSGLGGQIANVGFGLAGPAVESIQTQAEISGLRGIAAANQSAGNAATIANLAGQVFTPSNIASVGNFFNSTPPLQQPADTSAFGMADLSF